MPSIRRYGPALVTPQVAPRPELGRGRQQTFAAFQDIFNTAQDFIRPAVEEIQTARGEQEALAEVEERGPQWGLRQLQGSASEIAVTAARAGRSSPRPTALAARIMAGLEQRGLPRHIAQAFVLNFEDESGMDPSAIEAAPNVHGTRGFGLYQLTGDRLTAYEAFARQRGTQLGDMDAQLDWLMHELQGPERRAAERIMAASTTGEAAAEIVTWFLRPAAQHRDRRVAEYLGERGQSVSVEATPEYELETLNRSTFEPRRPFTFRDAAFNRAADRVITARATSAMEEGMRAAMQRADGDVGVLRQELEAVRRQVMSELPPEMPGLATELQTQFDRGRIAAERQAIDLSQRRVVQRQEEARTQILTATRAEAERLALTGATAAELADHMAQATDRLAAFGPREGFQIAGRTFAPDPSRAGTMTPGAIAQGVAEIALEARQMMIQSDFMRSEAPGAYVDEFRRQVYSGNSPLPAGQSLELLRSMEAQIRSADSARRTEAERERRRLEAEMGETINSYVSMTAAGVPVAIPGEERARILASLSAHPDLQRQAQREFAVADAQVATHGMTGPQLQEYVARVREDMRAETEQGRLDLNGAAVIASLQDRLRQVQNAVTSETIGLPMIEQLIRDGATADAVNYDGLREQAAGRPELLREIAEVEQFHRDAEQLSGMNAAERESLLEAARDRLAHLAAQGQGLGAEGLLTAGVLDRLGEWSEHRRGAAANDATQFARMVGVELPSLAGVETMGQAAEVVAARVNLLAPHTAPEGVEHPVPLAQAELDALSETFRNSPRGQQTAFLGTIAALGREQAQAIFSRIGQAEPVIYAAGMVYSMGNQEAAGVILRGSVDTRLSGAGPTDIQTARAAALGPALVADMIAPDSIEALDSVAVAYARGRALASGGTEITSAQLVEGYQVALGRQQDGTGGFHGTRYGGTILPPGWRGAFGMFGRGSGRSLEASIAAITPENQAEVLGGEIIDGAGRAIAPDRWRSTIETLLPSEDPNVFTPLDGDGAPFALRRGEAIDILTIDLRRLP